MILDREVNDYARLLHIARIAVRSGVDIIQLRDKVGHAKDVLAFSEKLMAILDKKVLFIVNDRVDIAKLSGADGVHLGQQDIPIEKARKIMGPQAVIGVSCQNLRHVKAAQAKGADYIGFGSVFKTLTKPERTPMPPKMLTAVMRQVRVPLFCIGGIDLKNISQIRKAGCDRVAVCRGVCLAQDIKEAIIRYQKALVPRQP